MRVITDSKGTVTIVLQKNSVLMRDGFVKKQQKTGKGSGIVIDTPHSWKNATS